MTKVVRRGMDSIEVSVQTRSDGCSAVLADRDANTEVYFGPLHASVKLFDLGIEVVMNPDQGEWSNLTWARNRAIETLKFCMSDWLPEFAALHSARGRAEGRRDLRVNLKNILFGDET